MISAAQAPCSSHREQKSAEQAWLAPKHNHGSHGFVSITLCGLVIAACLAPWLAAQDVSLDDFSVPERIEERLAAARAELGELPPDADPALIEQLQALEFACQYHLAAIETANKAKDARDEAAKAASSWRGYPQSAPYSVTLLDEVRETIAHLKKVQGSGETQHRLFAADLEKARNQLLEHRQAERRLLDAADTGSPEERFTAQRDLFREKLSSRIAAEQVGQLGLRLDAQQAELDMIQSQTQLAELRLDTIKDQITFPEEDLDAILERIESEREEAFARLMASDVRANESNPLLAWKVEFLDLEKTFWNTRFASFKTKDSSLRKQSLATLDELRRRIDDWIGIARVRLEGGATEAETIDPADLRDSLRRIEITQRLIAFAREDLGEHARGTPVTDRVASTMSSLWNMELYLAEETDIINGRKVPTYRAVTIGKLVRLAIILTVGWIILRFVTRRIDSLIARRSKLPEATAGILGKSCFALGLALLLLYGMNTVHIPLTVFAFLGGALAIGVGFGTQTLLKNFISGIILLFERPLKVGDVIDVAGITGHIRSIGIRASVIQHFDGIETLVPNSILLENQLTNWTFSNTVIRHSINVGVAYGSPTRTVSQTLLAVADSHGLVNKDPAPEVRFEDFGSDSLNFSLLFWLDISKIARTQLASDLRFMIDKAFAEADIVIAYPQRDIHFDREVPLRVELARSPTH